MIAALKAVPNEKLILSVVSLGEIVKGIGLLASGKRRDELTSWLTATPIDPSSMGTAAVALVSASATILARIGAAEEYASHGVDPNGLVAAEAASSVDDAVSLGFESSGELPGRSRLEGDRSSRFGGDPGRIGRTGVTEPGGVACVLNVHSMVNHVGNHLRVTLGLHIAPHHTEAEPGLTLFGHEARDDRMERSFVSLEPVGMFGVECEQTAAVLQGKAERAGDVL